MTSTAEAASALRCLSVQQPFAWAICAGIKKVENRTRGTDARGLIAIHAGTKQQRVNELVRLRGSELRADFFTFGAIIGVAELVDVVEMQVSLEGDPFACGPICWLLDNARLLPNPIPSKGKLNLYTLTQSESDQVRSQIAGLDPATVTSEQRAWSSAMCDEFSQWVGRAEGYAELNKHEDWIRCLDRAIEIDGSCQELYFDRALARVEANSDIPNAIADCDAALRLDPDRAAVYMLRAEAHRLHGSPAKATADEERAVAIQPDIREHWQRMDGRDDGDDI